MRFLAHTVGLAMTTVLVAQVAMGADETMEQRRASGPFKEGLALAVAGKNEEARVAFSQAYAAYPSPNILFNLAKAEALTGRTTAALRHFKQVTRDAHATAEAVRMSNDQVTALAKITGHARVVAPAGASLILDGEAWPDRAPLADVIDVLPGDHGIKADLDGQHAETTFHAQAGSTVDVTLAWPVPRAPASVAPSAPSASSSTAATPSPGVDIAPPPTQPQEPTSRTRWIVGGAIAGVGVVGVIVGAGFASASSSTKSDADALAAKLGPGSCAGGSPQCASLRSKQDDLAGQNTAAWVGYIGGGALIGVGIATVLLWPQEKKTQTGWFAPYMDRNGGGASFSGSF